MDLVTGLGTPLSKIVITTPVQAYEFTLQDEKLSSSGSPALGVTSLTRKELCQKISEGNWTSERDQDGAGPYLFR